MKHKYKNCLQINKSGYTITYSIIKYKHYKMLFAK